MDGKSNGNGHWDVHVFKDFQEQKFGSLESVLKDGFERVATELKALREEGYIPVSVMKEITEQQKQAFHPIIRTLCIALVAIIAWFTGLKALLPHVFPS
jgi:hypothetical protein